MSDGRGEPRSLLSEARDRGVLRAAASYAVIAWLLLQIADVTLDPLGVPKWVMTLLIAAAVLGFPVAVALAWFFEISGHGVQRDAAAVREVWPAAHGKRRFADLAIIGVLLVVVAVLLVRQSDIGKPPLPANPVIAVLPFKNLSGDPAQEYFSDGIATEILERLGQVPGLVVIARSSSFSFKHTSGDPRYVAERLGVTTLLEGGVRRAGNRLRLSARLVDGRSGRQLWSGSFDREVTDVFRLQEELAAAVVAAIVPAARGDATANWVAPTSNLNAHDLYLLGRSAQESRFGSRMHDSVAYLEKALQADPNYAKAHAALSRALVLWTVYPFEPAPPDAMQRAEAEAYRALALDPKSSEAHAALGTVLRQAGNTTGADSEYRRALEINPNNALALWDYIVLLSNDPATKNQATALTDRLRKLDPRSPMLWQGSVFEAAAGPDGEQAVRAEIEKAIAVLSDDADGLLQVYFAARRSGYAIEAYRVSVAIAGAGNPQMALFTAIRTWMLVGDLDRAQRTAEALAQVDDEEMAQVAGYYLQEIAGLKGDFATWSRLEREQAGNRLDDQSLQRSSAFWLAVQQRYPEAASALAKGEPIPDGAIGGLGASLIAGSQLLPAMLRIYRATGRGHEADTIAQRYLGQLREDPESGLDRAALAANEGLRDEAVQALEDLFERHPFVDFFHPQLPWFRSLEGHPGYDQLMAERARRIAKAHAEMVQLEAGANGAVLQLQ